MSVQNEKFSLAVTNYAEREPLVDCSKDKSRCAVWDVKVDLKESLNGSILTAVRDVFLNRNFIGSYLISGYALSVLRMPSLYNRMIRQGKDVSIPFELGRIWTPAIPLALALEWRKTGFNGPIGEVVHGMAAEWKNNKADILLRSISTCLAIGLSFKLGAGHLFGNRRPQLGYNTFN